MKCIGIVALALAGVFCNPISTHGISLDDIQLWSGSGTNRAAFVIEWSSPEVFDATTVPAPLADKTMVWGYRFNGTTNATAMLNAILGADPRLYVVENNTYGTYVVALGYNLQGNGIFGITDGTNIDEGSAFIDGVLTNETTSPDAAYPLNRGDLFWGGYDGPNWELWAAQGLEASPNRGTNLYWTSTDPNYYYGSHGQWEFSEGLDNLVLQEGSWIGFSVAAGGDNYLDTNSPGSIAYGTHKHAPVSPEGVYFAYIPNTNDFAVQVISSNNVDTSSPYNDPTAMLGRPTLQFFDPTDGSVTARVSLIDPPYNMTPAGGNVITEISDGGQVTVKLGRKVYDDPNNPYGMDLVVFGYSFFSPSGSDATVSDETDLDSVTLSSGFFGHSAMVSVSQDAANWYTFTNNSEIFPDNAYRWDETNVIWTEEEMNPTKPLNPSITGASLGGQTVAGALDQFAGSAGGTGYDLKVSGLPWIQYVRLQPAPGLYTVIDAIAVVNPTVVGDALAITPANVLAGLTNLSFENPAVSNEIYISVNFASIGDLARVSTVKLYDMQPFAPVPGYLSSAYQITVKSETGTNSVGLLANVALRASDSYAGNGGDLRVWQWGGTNWNLLPFHFNPTNRSVIVSGLTNLGAFVISQYIPPPLSIRAELSGYNFQFTPQPYVTYTLERASALGDSVVWTAIATATSTNAQPVTLQDNSPIATQAFYRLQLSP